MAEVASTRATIRNPTLSIFLHIKSSAQVSQLSLLLPAVPCFSVPVPNIQVSNKCPVNARSQCYPRFWSCSSARVSDLIVYSGGQQMYSVSSQIVNILGFVSHMPHLLTSDIVAQRQPQTIQQRMAMAVSQCNFIYRNRQWTGFGSKSINYRFLVHSLTKETVK